MIKTIAHLADIHIRKLHRFVEYRQVFKKLYKQLKDLKPDAIYIGGALGSSITEIGGGYSSYRYTGLLFGSFIKPKDAIHYFADVGLYSGKVSSEGLGGIVSAATEKFSIIEPKAGVGINLNDRLKATAGLSFKLVGAIDNSDISKKDIGGISLSGSIIYGF